MKITKQDLLKLIEQSNSTLLEKIEMSFIFGRNYESHFVVESKEGGVDLIFQNDNQESFFLKGILMNQFYNNKEWAV